MQAYATAERLIERVPTFVPTSSATSAPQVTTGAGSSAAVADQLLTRFADLVVERLTARLTANAEQTAGEWLDARAAAEYLGIHRDTLRKLAAERAVPVHQDGPGCKLYFRRDELHEWRGSSRARRSRLRTV